MTWRRVTGPAHGAPPRVCCFPTLALAIALNFALTCQSLEINVPVLALKSSAITLSLDPRETWPHTLRLWIEKRGRCVPGTSSFLRDDGTTASCQFVWLLPLERAQSLDENKRMKPAHVV